MDNYGGLKFLAFTSIKVFYGFFCIGSEEEENAYRPDMEKFIGDVYASNVTYQVLPPVQVLDVSMFRLWKKLQENGSSLGNKMNRNIAQAGINLEGPWAKMPFHFQNGSFIWKAWTIFIM